MFKIVIGAASVLLASAMAIAGTELKGGYAESGSGTCVISQAGFNADMTPIVTAGEIVGTIPVTIRGTASFNAATGRGSFEGINVYTIDVVIPGAAQPYYFGTAKGKQTTDFKFATSTNAKGETILSVTPDPNGGETTRVLKGTGTGDVSTTSNAANLRGLVTSSGAIALANEEPVVATEVVRHPDGTANTYYEVCTYQATLNPL